MTYPTREHEELLRRALRVAADSVEPAADGLERIRARLTTPRPTVAAWMMSVAEPAILWIRPLLTRLHQATAPVLGRLSWLRQATAPVLGRLSWLRQATAPVRGRLWPGRGALRPHPGWLRPAAAVAAFVVIIGSGALAIRALQHTITQTGAPISIGVAEGTSSGQSRGAVNGKGHKLVPPVPLVPLDPSMPEFWPLHTATSPPPQAPRTTPAATPSCSPTVTSPSPTPASPSVSPTVTPTTTSPSPTPTTTSPTPTPTTSPTAGVTTAPSSAGASTSAAASTEAVAAAPLSSGAGSTNGSPSPGVRTGTC